MYEARIERDSITQYGERLITAVFTLPRIVLAELNTHRVFSRSSASSRAIPVEKQIKRVREDLFLPVYWGKNQKGMQAEQELSDPERRAAVTKWAAAADSAVDSAQGLLALGVHKQITNRLLEPFMWHTVIVTATEWSNWEHLRVNKKAQPEIRKAAEMVLDATLASKPKLLREDEWHLPFWPEEETARMAYSDEEQIRMSVGRSARVSYLNHDGEQDPVADKALAGTCLESGHMAPWEHVARPMTSEERVLFGRARVFAAPGRSFTNPLWVSAETQYFCGNFNGWIQARKLIHGEEDSLAFAR